MRSSPRGTSSARLTCEALEDRTTPTMAYALGGTLATNLVGFDTANPALTTTVPITGVAGAELLVGIDFRPQNGVLYGLGVNGATGNGTLYAISLQTGFAGIVGTVGSVDLPADLPHPAIANTGYGFDFNPTTDRIRVVDTAGQSFTINPNTGLVAAIAPTLNGATAKADGSAYTNDVPGATTTQLYAIDGTSDALYVQDPLTSATTVVGSLFPNFTNLNGFDIVSSSGTDTAFAALSVNGFSALYSINLTTGSATAVGLIGSGAVVSGLALQGDFGGYQAIGLAAGGGQLLRFNTGATATVTPVTITGINAAETLVGIDYRPATGQLYGLGINATANTGTLYVLDTQTGAATPVSGTGLVQFVQADGTTAVDFPDPATAGYGFDFNPALDKIRVTTSTGLNFRIDPDTGAPIDGDLNTTPAPPGVNTDGPIMGVGVTGVSAAAYTNSFGRDLTAPIGPTTQYTLDATSGKLFIQNPPGSGIQLMGVPVTLGGAPLAFTDVNGFDIPGAQVTTSGAVASGFGYAALTVGGVTSAYRINLTTGVAESLGTIGAGATQVSGLAVGRAPAGNVSFASASFSASETGGNAAIQLVRTGGSAGPITVTVTVTGGTATQGVDFPAGPYTVTFPDGATGVTLNLPITDDRAVEGTEFFTLALSAPTAGGLGAQTTTTVTIADNDVLQPVAFAAGLGAGIPVVATYASNGGLSRVINAYPGLADGVKVAVGDVNGDGIDDLVTVPATSFPVINVYDGASGNLIGAFVPFTGLGPASIAVGDVNGDGKGDIIVGTASNYGIVYVFSGADFSLLGVTLPFGVVIPVGVNVAAGDTDGDGRAEIIFSTASLLAAYGIIDGQSFALRGAFLPYGPIAIGATVGAGDTDGDGKAEIIIGLATDLPVVGVFNARNGNLRGVFLAVPGQSVGVNVAAADTNNDGLADILVSPMNGPARALSFNGIDLSLMNTLFPFGAVDAGLYVG